MSKQTNTLKVQITDIETNLFVRKNLDHDWALELALHLEHGAKLPPIKIAKNTFYSSIAKTWIMIDGRHRTEGHVLNKLEEIECEVVEVKDEREIIALAYKANLGGSLPPRAEDTEHTVALLMNRGEPLKNIAELLGLPSGVARKYVRDVKSRQERAKELLAVKAVTEENLSIPKAAEREGVDEDRLREIMGGKSRKHRKGIEDVQRNLTKLYKSVSSKNAALMRKLVAGHEDGEISVRQLEQIFAQLEGLHKKAARSLADWKKRFEALSHTSQKAS